MLMVFAFKYPKLEVPCAAAADVVSKAPPPGNPPLRIWLLSVAPAAFQLIPKLRLFARVTSITRAST